MSYSISARGATLALALGALAVAFDQQVIAQQPMHARDRDAALAAADLMGKQLGEQPEGKEVGLSLSGSLTWTGEAGAYNTIGANVSATAYFTDPLPATPA